MTGNMLSVFTVYKTLYNWTQAKFPNLVRSLSKQGTNTWGFILS